MSRTFRFASLVLPAALLSVALFGAGAVCAAQQNTSPPAPIASSSKQQKASPTIKVGTRIITISVIATDHSGNAIRDLKPSEFRVFEKAADASYFHGKDEEQIAQFRFVDASAEDNSKAASAAPPQGIYTNQINTEGAGVPPTVLLVDALNTDTSAQVDVRIQMVRMLRTLPANVPVAIFLLGRNLRMLQGFTRNTDLLHAAIEKAVDPLTLAQTDPRDDPNSVSSQLATMAGRDNSAPLTDSSGARGSGQNQGSGKGKGNSQAPSVATMLAQVAESLRRFEKEQFTAQIDMRVSLTLGAFQALARYLSGIPGRKNVVWLSNSFPIAIAPDSNDGKLAFEANQDFGDRIRATANLLADSQIAVYPIDVRGVEIPNSLDAGTGGFSRVKGSLAKDDRQTDMRLSSEESMIQVANDTGGRVCKGNNDLAACVKAALKDGSSYYEIAYYPANNEWNGAFRNITIKTTRPGVSLHYRRGYYASDTNVSLAKNEKEAQQDTARAAMSGDAPVATAIPLTAQVTQPDQPGVEAFLVLIGAGAIRFVPKGQQFEVHLNLAAATFDPHGTFLHCYVSQIDKDLTQDEYDAIMTKGLLDYVSIAQESKVARVRIAVRDTSTGLLGSVDVPLSSAGGS